ncbi:hypothetical protein KL949_001490 [Ogataea haglerorum]|nr:hypothetical protein KL913_001880 [Ogataea haglerorum]KAG7721758.1 hypothetical protein KL949_001490 [Ogataea haglerorum]KAG7770086.1 hypothetical protein KL931_002605 [Ogataea haglerorum]
MNTKIKREKQKEDLSPAVTDEHESDADDSSASSSDESSSESVRESASESEVSKREMSEREQFELQAKYRRLDRALVQQRTEVARENGIQVVSTSLDIADQLFSETKTSIQSNIVAKDAATLKEIGLQAKLATRNLKLGRSERVLNFAEFSSNFQRFFATEDDMVDVDSPADRGMALPAGAAGDHAKDTRVAAPDPGRFQEQRLQDGQQTQCVGAAGAGPPGRHDGKLRALFPQTAHAQHGPQKPVRVLHRPEVVRQVGRKPVLHKLPHQSRQDDSGTRRDGRPVRAGGKPGNLQGPAALRQQGRLQIAHRI